MELKIERLEIPEGCNVIFGQTHFIKTVEDLYEMMVTSVPNAKFGIAEDVEIIDVPALPGDEEILPERTR